MSEDDVKHTCDQCGASVYQQHLDSKIAKYIDDKLHCSHCVAEFGDSGGDGDGFGDDLVPIEFDDEDDTATVEMHSTRIKSAAGLSDDVWDDTKFKRPLKPTAAGASRCRTFHCRISQGAIDFLNNQINEWLDENKEITIKSTNTVIGMFEGKHTEPNMIVNIFY